jgi:hypothetical protein
MVRQHQTRNLEIPGSMRRRTFRRWPKAASPGLNWWRGRAWSALRGCRGRSSSSWRTIERLAADPAIDHKLTAVALEPLTGSTPDRFAAYVKTEVARWAVIVRNSGAELE